MRYNRVNTNPAGRVSTLGFDCDEIVIGQEAHVLPAYIFELKKGPEFIRLAQNWMRETFGNETLPPTVEQESEHTSWAKDALNFIEKTQESGALFLKEPDVPDEFSGFSTLGETIHERLISKFSEEMDLSKQDVGAILKEAISTLKPTQHQAAPISSPLVELSLTHAGITGFDPYSVPNPEPRRFSEPEPVAVSRRGGPLPRTQTAPGPGHLLGSPKADGLRGVRGMGLVNPLATINVRERENKPRDPNQPSVPFSLSIPGQAGPPSPKVSPGPQSLAPGQVHRGPSLSQGSRILSPPTPPSSQSADGSPTLLRVTTRPQSQLYTSPPQLTRSNSDSSSPQQPPPHPFSQPLTNPQIPNLLATPTIPQNQTPNTLNNPQRTGTPPILARPSYPMANRGVLPFNPLPPQLNPIPEQQGTPTRQFSAPLSASAPPRGTNVLAPSLHGNSGGLRGFKTSDPPPSPPGNPSQSPGSGNPPQGLGRGNPPPPGPPPSPPNNDRPREPR